jgi:GTPase Era involved in 16S rRNA processing
MDGIETENKIDRKVIESAIIKMENFLDDKETHNNFEVLSELKNKVRTRTVNFAVIGQFKRGKSSFINAILGKEILPTSIIPLTSVITFVKYSNSIYCKVLFEDGNNKITGPEKLVSYIGESENPGNIKNVMYVEIGFPNDILKKGVIFIDTPGIGSLHLNNTISTYKYLPKIDAAIFLTSSDPALSETEVELINEVKSITGNIFFVLNKIDYLSRNELDEFVSYTMKYIHIHYPHDNVKIFPVSSRMALNSKLTDDHQSLENSGIPGFEKFLESNIVDKKENILFDSVRRQMISLINEEEMAFEIKIKSVLMPLEELKIKQDNLNRSFEYFSNVDIPDISNTVIGIKSLISAQQSKFRGIKNVVLEKIKTGIQRFEKDFLHSGKAEFKSELAKLFHDIVKKELEKKRIEIESEVKEKSAAIFKEALDNYNRNINQIYRIVSELFDIKIAGINYYKEYEISGNFEYMTYEFNLILDLPKSLLMLLLPRKIYNRINIRRLLERADFTINYNLSYITDNIEKKLEKALIDYRIVLKNSTLKTTEKIKDIIREIEFIRRNKEYDTRHLLESLNYKLKELVKIKDELVKAGNNVGI